MIDGHHPQDCCSGLGFGLLWLHQTLGLDTELPACEAIPRPWPWQGFQKNPIQRGEDGCGFRTLGGCLQEEVQHSV